MNANTAALIIRIGHPNLCIKACSSNERSAQVYVRRRIIVSIKHDAARRRGYCLIKAQNNSTHIEIVYIKFIIVRDLEFPGAEVKPRPTPAASAIPKTAFHGFVRW